MNDTYLYEEYGNLYVNLTNKCSNSCSFCVRNNHDGVENRYLWLSREPDAADVTAVCPQNLDEFSEVVFCGYGEPTYRLETLIEVARFFKKKNKKIRLNTNGQSDLINKKPTAVLLKGLVDCVSVSLNASNAARYDEICKPVFENAFSAMISFAKDCKNNGIETVMSVVDVIGENELIECGRLCEKEGLRLRVRSYITP